MRRKKLTTDDPELEELAHSVWGNVPRNQIPLNWREVKPTERFLAQFNGDEQPKRPSRKVRRPREVRFASSETWMKAKQAAGR